MESDPERPSDPVVAYFVSRIPRLRRCNSLQPVGPSHTSSMGGKQAALAASNSPDRPDGCSETKTLIRLVRDQDALLDLCDQVRECIREDGQLGPRAQTFTSVLRFMLDRESTLAGPAIPLRTIRTTHLDKLLTEVVAATDGASSKSLQVNAAVAEALQSRWRARFRAAYFCLDHERRKGLLGGGDSPPPSPGDARRRDRPKSRVPKVGHWWPGLACAHADGFPCPDDSMPTLLLLTGSELVQWPTAQVTYTREGSMSDMFLPLMAHVGRRVRVVRGPLLESMFAPQAGVRYDGEYLLVQYGQKVNSRTKAHRLSIVLDRVEDQRRMHELLRIPRPSHLDDWEIFDEFEEQVMRSQLGRSQFDEWLLDRARDAIDKEHFDRFMRLVSAVAMRESISRAERTGEGTNRLGMVRRIEHLVWER